MNSIYSQTEGNPFFVEEVAKALVEEGDLDYRDGRWERRGEAELDIPQSVRLAIRARVGRLPLAAPPRGAPMRPGVEYRADERRKESARR